MFLNWVIGILIASPMAQAFNYDCQLPKDASLEANGFLKSLGESCNRLYLLCLNDPTNVVCPDAHSRNGESSAVDVPDSEDIADQRTNLNDAIDRTAENVFEKVDFRIRKQRSIELTAADRSDYILKLEYLDRLSRSKISPPVGGSSFC
jgi:hypothetical protein